VYLTVLADGPSQFSEWAIEMLSLAVSPNSPRSAMCPLNVCAVTRRPISFIDRFSINPDRAKSKRALTALSRLSKNPSIRRHKQFAYGITPMKLFMLYVGGNFSELEHRAERREILDGRNNPRLLRGPPPPVVGRS